MKMIRVQVNVRVFLYDAIQKILARGYECLSDTVYGDAWVTKNGKTICRASNHGGRLAPPNHSGDLVIELPDKCVRPGVKPYRGKVKTA